MSKILVTGSTGQLGVSVINHLLKLTTKDNIVALARDANKAASFAKQGVQIRIGDYNNKEALTNALKGINKLLLISGLDENRLEQHKLIVDLAVQAGVKYIAYTSVSHVGIEKSAFPDFINTHFLTEQHIKKSGIPYTILRNNLYTQVIPNFVGQKVFETGIHLPAGNGRVPFVARDDLGEATARILVNQKNHINQTYDLLGGEQLTFGDVANILSELSGKEVKYISGDSKTFPDLLRKFQVPEHFIFIVAGFAEDIKNNLFSINSNKLQQILQRKPTNVKQTLKAFYKL